MYGILGLGISRVDGIELLVVCVQDVNNGVVEFICYYAVVVVEKVVVLDGRCWVGYKKFDIDQRQFSVNEIFKDR